jgi:XTP/dITP diphosphohydrolase
LRCLLATQNRGKLRELQSVLGDCGLELITLENLDELPDAVEDGLTFAENARKKALHYFHLTQLPTIADDSGLAVEALGGQPGVHSARFAPTDAERIEKLLRLLESVEDGEDREARFVCAICLCFSSDRRIEVEATVHGEITWEPRGSTGFGYDPVFYYPPLGRTFAELTAAEKNRVSHRAKALNELKQELSVGGWELGTGS